MNFISNKGKNFQIARASAKTEFLRRGWEVRTCGEQVVLFIIKILNSYEGGSGKDALQELLHHYHQYHHKIYYQNYHYHPRHPPLHRYFELPHLG